MFQSYSIRSVARSHLRRRGVLWTTAAVTLVLLILVTAAPWVRADAITVCGSGCQHATIQEAIDAGSTQAGDTVSVLDAFHTEAGIVVDKDVTIAGAGASGSVVQAHAAEDAASDRVMTIEATASVVIRALTIRHGKVIGKEAQGGGILNLGTLALDRVTVTANRAVGADGWPGGNAQGGGIYSSGVLTITESTVRDNLAQGGDGNGMGADGGHAEGGGIGTDAGSIVSMLNSTISGNTVEFGYGFG